MAKTRARTIKTATDWVMAGHNAAMVALVLLVRRQEFRMRGNRMAAV